MTEEAWFVQSNAALDMWKPEPERTEGEEFEDALALRAGWYQWLGRAFLMLHRFSADYLDVCRRVYGVGLVTLGNRGFYAPRYQGKSNAMLLEARAAGGMVIRTKQKEAFDGEQ